MFDEFGNTAALISKEIDCGAVAPKSEPAQAQVPNPVAEIVIWRSMARPAKATTMIKYALQCSNGHRFDAWFSNSKICDEQIDAGFVSCANCGDSSVKKSLMAPSITRSPKRAAFHEISREPEAATTSMPQPTPASGEMATAGQVREALHMLRRYVEKNADYVGNKFADEARKIHHGESDERGIYGETSPEEAEALEEEGVPFGRMPWIQNDA